MKLTKEFKVGLFALITGVILYMGFNYLKGADLFSSTRQYFVIYDDIDGLTVSNTIVLKGMVVGRVEKIAMMPDRNNDLLVTLDIDADVVLNEASKAILTDSDFLGGKTITLDVGNSPNKLQPEDTLIADVGKGITDVIQEKAVPVLDNLDSTAKALYVVIKEFEGTAVTVKSTLKNFEQTSGTLNSMLADNQSNVKNITGNFAKLSSDLKPIVAKMDQFADTLNNMELAKAVDNANKSIAELNAIMDKVNRGEGSMGKLMTNDSLYTNLNNSSFSLNELLKDVKENPRRYINVSVFGRRDKD